MKTPPQPSMEWEITTRCNYVCSYCCQKHFDREIGRHCSDATVDAVLRLLAELPGQWSVKIIGGEPAIHPRFLEICRAVAASGHTMTMTTNFSLPFERFLRLAEIAGDKLTSITASLHLEQVKSLDEFVEKAIAFNSAKNPVTVFTVTSVCLENQIEVLKRVGQRLGEAGVAFRFQWLKTNGRFVEYHDGSVADYISDKLIDSTDEIRGSRLYGTLCHTGHLFFRINSDGDVVRCFNRQPLYHLGNITDGTFRRLSMAMPCLSPVCTCTVPANRGMILYGQRATKVRVALALGQASVRNLRRDAAHTARRLKARAGAARRSMPS